MGFIEFLMSEKRSVLMGRLNNGREGKFPCH